MPVTLGRLAEYLRDGELIDMRVLHEDEIVTLERVCIHEINIRKYDEGLLVTQEFVDGETKLSHDIVVECDNVLRAWPTGLDLETVNPVREIEPEPDTLEDTDGIMDAAWFAVAKHMGTERDQTWRDKVMARGNFTTDMDRQRVAARHLVILTTYHTSDLAPLTICKLVGYASQQPFISACQRFHEPTWRKMSADEKAAIKALRKSLAACVKTVRELGFDLRTEGKRAKWLLG